MRQVSDRLREAVYAQESNEVFIPIVKMSHPDWEDDVRIVRDNVALTHGGEVYQPFIFSIRLPDDEDEGFPVLRFSIENVSQALIANFRSFTGSVYARVSWVLAATPDVIEAGPFDVELTGIEYDSQAIGGTMSIEPILQEGYGHLMFTPKNTPALF